MTKVAFFYANGTAYPPRDPVGLFKMITPLFGPAPKPPGLLVIPGLDGHNIGWMDGSPQNDPFPAMLDPDIFTAVKVEYPAWSFPMNLSIGKLVDSTKALIGDLPKGQKFGIGGWSQGAAAMSTVYNEIRSGSLQSRASDFIGGVAFGNPRRQLNYRGEVGGTYSGAWNVPGSTTGGGGSFPATGPYARLTNCEPSQWIEFCDVDDIFAACNGSNKDGSDWMAFCDYSVGLSQTDMMSHLGDILGGTFIKGIEKFVKGVDGGAPRFFVDANGKSFAWPGGGHSSYPWAPPPGNPDNGLTSFQIAAKWLTLKAQQFVTAPTVLPSTPGSASATGWVSTLYPPTY